MVYSFQLSSFSNGSVQVSSGMEEITRGLEDTTNVDHVLKSDVVIDGSAIVVKGVASSSGVVSESLDVGDKSKVDKHDLKR